MCANVCIYIHTTYMCMHMRISVCNKCGSYVDNYVPLLLLCSKAKFTNAECESELLSQPSCSGTNHYSRTEWHHKLVCMQCTPAHTYTYCTHTAHTHTHTHTHTRAHAHTHTHTHTHTHAPIHKP